MEDFYTALLLLNLTKQETELLLALYYIYKSETTHNELYTIEEISKLVGHSSFSIESTLNKLMLKNIIGRITYKGIINPEVEENFDEDFLVTLYNKKKPFESAKEKAGFYIDAIEKRYVLNPALKSWKYVPKSKVVAILKRLKKLGENKFVAYLLESYNNGKKGSKRKQSSERLNGWNHKHAVEMFRSKYKINYGNSYEVGVRDYISMKKIIEQLTNNGMHKDNFDPFLDYAFTRALSADYILQIIGLKYYANEFLTNIVNKGR